MQISISLPKELSDAFVFFFFLNSAGYAQFTSVCACVNENGAAFDFHGNEIATTKADRQAVVENRWECCISKVEAPNGERACLLAVQV